MNNSFIQMDRAASYIPGVSTIVNLPEIIYKIFIINELDQKTLESDSIKSYLSGKSLVRCIILLVPFLGNLAIIASDLVELARSHKNNSPSTTPPDSVVPSENIDQLIEEREKVEAQFQEVVPFVKKILKNEGTLLTPKLEESIKVISNVTNSLNTTADQCELVTKKIINFSEKDDDYLGKIIDTIALGAIVYMGSGLTVMGLCGSAITLKVWSFFRGASS